MPNMTEGAEAAEAISDEIKASSPKRFRFRQYQFKVGEDVLIRFITDRVTRPLKSGEGTMPGWITADTHGFIPTKPKPEDYTGQNWPDKMWAICQLDRMFRVRDAAGEPLDEYEPGYGNCYIHNTFAGVREGPFNRDTGRPDAQVYALAVLREPVLDSASPDPKRPSVIGFKDKTTEWTDPDGNILVIPHFVVVSQKWMNFYAPVAAACYAEPRTATNKDFLVKRPDQKTYTISPVNLDPKFMTGTDEWAQQYEAPLAAMKFDLREYLLSHASTDHYARWFVPGATPEGGYARKDDTAAEENPAAAANGAAPATPQIDQKQMADFAAQLQNRGN